MRDGRNGELSDDALLNDIWCITLQAVEGGLTDHKAICRIFEVIHRNRRTDIRQGGATKSNGLGWRDE